MEGGDYCGLYVPLLTVTRRGAVSVSGNGTKEIAKWSPACSEMGNGIHL